MTVQAIQKDPSNDSYKTAALGAATGGVGTYGTISHKLTKLSKETTKALQQTDSTVCDAFIKKNETLINKAIDSKKGFFGKINSLISKNGSSAKEDIASYTDSILEGYADKARRSASKTGKNIEQKFTKLYEKYISKDILKSFKNATKYETIVKVSIGAAVGLFAACCIKQVAAKQNEKQELIKQTKTGSEVQNKKVKSDAKSKKTKTKTDTKSKETKAEAKTKSKKTEIKK